MPTKQVETKQSRSESNPRAMSELLPLNRKWQKGEVENSLILSMRKKRWSLRRILTSKRGWCAKTEERKSVHSFSVVVDGVDPCGVGREYFSGKYKKVL